MYFDRIDICEAWYLFLCDYHEGQGSERYARLSRLCRFFTPRAFLASADDLTENGRAIYDSLASEAV